MARRTAVVRAAADTVESLHAQYRTEPVQEVCVRLHVLWQLRLRERPTVAAAVVYVGRSSGQRWRP